MLLRGPLACCMSIGKESMSKVQRFRITFLGAAQTVTGSMHLLEADGFGMLVDCGGVNDTDNCGNSRTNVSCGTCTSGSCVANRCTANGTCTIVAWRIAESAYAPMKWG